MSVRMALAKLAAVAAGGALVGGGAVHVAEPQAEVVEYKSAKPQALRYVKEQPRAHRAIPKRTKRIRRVIEEQDCCEEQVAMIPIPLPQLPQQPMFIGGG